jgi:hypothetical protein
MLQFAVYRRRQLVEALKTRALLVASLGSEQAEQAAKAYFEVALPVAAEDKLIEDLAKARQLEEIDILGVIPMAALRPAGSRAVAALDKLAGLRQ